MGYVTDITALQRSSNVYMFLTAIKIGGGNYIPNSYLSIKSDTFSIMRNHYAQFGLGTRTGIDLPNEGIGSRGPDSTAGLLLDLSIGQYDTYTPMQLAQYVSTIASGGKRLQPRLVKEIREPSNRKSWTCLSAVPTESLKYTWKQRSLDGSCSRRLSSSCPSTWRNRC